jgi:hypothetical protein
MHLAVVFKGSLHEGTIEVDGVLYPAGEYEEVLVPDPEDAVKCARCERIIGYENPKQRHDATWDADEKRRPDYLPLDYGEVDGKPVCPGCHPKDRKRVRFISYYTGGIQTIVMDGKESRIDDFVEYEEISYDRGRVYKRLSHRKIRENLEYAGMTCEELDDIQDAIEARL